MTIEIFHNHNYMNSHFSSSTNNNHPHATNPSCLPSSSSSSDDKNLLKTNFNLKRTQYSRNKNHRCPTTILEGEEAVDAQIDFNQKFFVPDEPLFLVLPSDEPRERSGSSRSKSRRSFPPKTVAFPSRYRLRHHEPSPLTSTSTSPNPAKRKSHNISHGIGIMGRVATYASSSNHRRVTPDDGGALAAAAKSSHGTSRRPSRRFPDDLDPADAAGGGGGMRGGRNEERRIEQDKTKKPIIEAVAPPQTQILVPYRDPRDRRRQKEASRPREDPPDVDDLRRGRRRGTGLDPDGDGDGEHHVENVNSKDTHRSRRRRHGPTTGNGGTRRNKHRDDSSSVGSSRESSAEEGNPAIVYPQLDNGGFDFDDTDANLGTSQLTFRGKDPPDGNRGKDPITSSTGSDDASGIHALDVVPSDPPERDPRRTRKGGGGGGHASQMIQRSIDEKRRSKRRSSGKRNSEKLSSSLAIATVTMGKDRCAKGDGIATAATASADLHGQGVEDNEKSAKTDSTSKANTKTDEKTKKKKTKEKEIKSILKKKSTNPPPIAYFGGTFPGTPNDAVASSSSSSDSEHDKSRVFEKENRGGNEQIVIHVGKIHNSGDDKMKKEKKNARASSAKKQTNNHKLSTSSKQSKAKSKQRQRHDDGNEGDDDESVGVRSIGTKSGLRQGRFAAANAAAASKVDKNKFDSFSDDEMLDEDEVELYGSANRDVDETFSENEDNNGDGDDDDILLEEDQSFRGDNRSLDRSSSGGESKINDNNNNKKKNSSQINKLDEGASTLFDCTSSSYEDPVPIKPQSETETSPFDRTRSHFLRTADLGMTQDTIFAQQFLEHPTDIPEPHYHHPTPHPPPGVQFHIDESWISVDDGKGGHSPIAPQAVDALINMGYRVASDPMMWTPTVKTRRFMTERRLRFDDIPIPGPLDEGEGGPGDVSCLLWSGKFSHKKYHGHELPVIRSQGIVNMCAEELVDLLMDSRRVNEYNPSSIGRNDDLILSDGKKEHCPFSGQRKKKLSGVVIDGARIVDGSAMMEDEQSEFTRESENEEEIVFDDFGNRSVRSYNTDSSRREKKVSQFVGVTKLVRTTNRLPLIRKRLQFVTMLHCRALSDDQGGNGYIIVGRAVVPAEDAEKTQKVMRSEILLSVHIIRRLGGNKRSVGSSGNSVVSSSSGKKASKSDLANRCLMINVTHIKSPMIPNILAKKVGLSAAANFLADIRNLAK